jgi:hypothetical protein
MLADTTFQTGTQEGLHHPLFLYNDFIRIRPMTVRHEIKSQLAKLLATEDLVVEHKKVETACFNVHTRVLTLPMWEKASAPYMTLAGPSRSFMLYTPDEDWLKDHKIPSAVCECGRRCSY